MKKFLFSALLLFFCQWVVAQKGGEAIQATLDSTNLPIVFINTNFQSIPNEPKIEAGMAIIDNGYNVMNHVTDQNYKYYGKIGIEQRGSISQQWWWTQKSYAVETHDLSGADSNAVILGMPKENDWVLYGPFSEATLMKNVLTFELVREMGYWAPRTKFCEMMLKTGFTWNYNGVYVMMEKIKQDKNRVDIAKLDANDNAGDSLTGGYIIAVDRNINAVDSGWFSSHPQSANVFLTYKYPKGDEITTQQMTYIQAYVDSFENALSSANFANPLTGFRKYMDPVSFQDFFFIQEMSKNIDAYKRSSYLTKDKTSKGGKLMASPHWDYNSAWEVKLGGCEPFDADTGWTYPLTCWIHGTNYPVPFWWKRLLQDTTYTRDMKCRWTQLRSSVLSNTNINHVIDSIANYVSAASVRHYSQFSIASTYQAEVNNLKTWIAKRLVWMDAHMPGNCWNLSAAEMGSVNSGVTLYPNPSSGIFNLGGNQKIFKAAVLNMFGQTVRTIREDQEISSVDISELPSGVYFLKCFIEGAEVSMKLVKL